MSAARRLVLLVLAIFLTVLAVPARAAETDPDDENIPSTAVARLKVSKGTVWSGPPTPGNGRSTPTISPWRSARG